MRGTTPFLAAPLIACTLLAVSSGATEGRSVPKGASQQEALEAVSRATGKLVLAEKTRVDRRSAQEIPDAGTGEGLSRVTREYHLHAMVGPDRILFVRRFWDTKEPLDLPVEEIRSIVSSLYDLTEPLSCHVEQKAVLKTEFYRSLTPLQISAAQNRALKLADLSENQRRAWNLVEADLLLGPPILTLRQLNGLFSNWEVVHLDWLAAPDVPAGHLERLDMRWTGSDGRAKSALLLFGLRLQDEPAPAEGFRAQSSVEAIPPAPRPVTRCPARCGPLAEPIRLSELAAVIGAANGAKIDVPTWAADREFYVFAENRSGDEVLRALADANGWRLRAVGPKRFALERPQVHPAENYVDYFRGARALVPPIVRLLIPPLVDPEDPFSREEAQHSLDALRRARGLPDVWKVASQVLKLDSLQQGLPLSALDADCRRLIANRKVEGDFMNIVGRRLGTGPLSGLITDPDQCDIRIEGDPNGSPIVSFEYLPRPGEPRERGLFVGWVVNWDGTQGLGAGSGR